MIVTFSEISDNYNSINKTINADGSKSPNASVYSAKGRTVRLELQDFKTYLESLSSQPEKAVILGVTGLEEFEIATKKNMAGNQIARTRDFFKYCNSDQVGLMLLDIDSNSDHGPWSKEEIGGFVGELYKLLEFCLIGENKPFDICRFERESSTAAVFKDGAAVGNGYHIYLPVKNPSEKLIELIFKWAWLSGYQSYLISKDGSVLIRSIIDEAVKMPERLVFESDCTTVSDEFEVKFRECKFIPGGVIDSELAIPVLEAAVNNKVDETVFHSGESANFSVLKSRFVKEKSLLPEVALRRKKHDEEEAEKIAKLRNIPKAAARSIVEKRRTDFLLSSDYIVLDDYTEAKIYDILTEPSVWNGRSDIRPPGEPEYGESKAKIFVNSDDSVMLHSFAHGGRAYRLAFDCFGVLEWIDKTGKDDVQYEYTSVIAASKLDDDEIERIADALKDKIGSKLPAIRKKITEALEKQTHQVNVEGDRILIDEKAPHIDIALDLFRSFGSDCVIYGQSLYAFEKTIWKSMSGFDILYKIATAYKHCGKCQSQSQYDQIYRSIMTVVAPKYGYKESWDCDYGVPCANYFWKFDLDNKSIEPVKYTREIGARHKISFEPDFKMRTPMFDAYLHNVVNAECLQKLLGLTLCGVMPMLQQAGVLKGAGGAGKGTITKILTSMMSQRRVISMGLSDFNRPTAVKDLVDAAIAIIPEADGEGDPSSKRRKINLSGFKKATGGDIMRGKILYFDEFSFTPRTSYLISMNNWPNIDSFHAEISRRLSAFIVEFKIQHKERIFALEEKIIKHELPGVLAWMINGVKKWFDDSAPDAHSLQLFDEWRKSVDTVFEFVTTKVAVKAGGKLKRAELYRVYKDFCQEHNLEPVSNHTLYDWCRQNGIKEGHGEDGDCFRGIQII